MAVFHITVSNLNKQIIITKAVNENVAAIQRKFVASNHN